MDYYCDIRVLPDPEASEPVLVNNLFAKLHRVLVQLNANDIGVSFPNVKKTLGNILRLHGSAARLAELLATNWLKGLRDYCEVQPIMTVPNEVTYLTVSRVQAKSVYNKRKRSITKGWLSEAEAQEQITDDQQKQLQLPFVQINSSSTLQNYIKLFIKHGEKQAMPVTGEFSCYGLSKNATVPWF